MLGEGEGEGESWGALTNKHFPLLNTFSRQTLDGVDSLRSITD